MTAQRDELLRFAKMVAGLDRAAVDSKRVPYETWQAIHFHARTAITKAEQH